MKEVEFCPKESKVEPVVFSDALRTQALVVLGEISGNSGTIQKDGENWKIIYKWHVDYLSHGQSILVNYL
jgi:hypothetical protein